MVKKKFIDKKRSVTYNLVFRSTEDADSTPERTLVEAGAGGEGFSGSGPDVDAAIERSQNQASERRYPPGHPLAWIEEEQLQGELSEERRRELIELGFPDDGYDYLKHVRTLGHGTTSIEAAASESASVSDKIVVEAKKKSSTQISEAGPVGPAVFMKANALHQPEEDVAIFDAARLVVIEKTDAEEEAAEMMGGVSAFALRTDTNTISDIRGDLRKEMEEIEAMMHELEEDDDTEELETDPIDDNGRVRGRILGQGDLLDDFILSATLVEGEELNDEDDDGENDPHEAWSTEDENDDDSPSITRPPPRPGSIASTYWRDERMDRKNLLGVIDERFENLALEYDEDEIGSMEEAAEAGDIQGFADISDFDHLLNEFLDERKAMRGRGDEVENEDDVEKEVVQNGQDMPARQRPRGESILKARLEAAGYDDADAEVAIEYARAVLRRMEQEEEEKVAVEDVEAIKFQTDPTAGWDCESILSLRSNMYNHPGTITEPGRKTTVPPSGLIKLNKAGLPAGVVLPGSAVREAKIADGSLASSSRPALQHERRKDESAEEKKARKNAVKEAKREARVAKKELKTLYKEETAKAHKRAATAQVQPSIIL